MKFELSYKKFIIGHLTYDEFWHFTYSESFKQQDKYRPLVQFPIIEKEYKSKNLWAFFLLRIPSLKQSSIQKTIQEEKIPIDYPSLLERFGKKVIQNPFLLERIQ